MLVTDSGPVSVSLSDVPAKEVVTNGQAVRSGPGQLPHAGENGCGLPLPSAEILEALQAAVYTTDALGRITFYNQAAVALWGIAPEIGKSEFCGAWKMRWPDGSPLPHDQCPMAVALKEGRTISGAEAIAVRPDGTEVPFLSYPTPIRDAKGVIVGAVNMLIDIGERRRTEQSAQMLAAIVESSDDAIVSKDLNGIIASWNAGAEQLFGYKAEEAIGKPILMLIPTGRHNEEPEILARIRRGERIDHYETIRRRKDGSLVEISLTVSPIRDGSGKVVGASKIARDITERRRVEEQRRLLLKEMSHRVKNLFSLAGSIVEISARHAETPQEMARSVRARLGALSRAHQLTLPSLRAAGDRAEEATSLEDLLRTVVEPYLDAETKQQIEFHGPAVEIGAKAVTGLSLLLHEFTTNAAKYGALSSAGGQLSVEWRVENGHVRMVWRESGGPPIAGEPEDEGFGSLMTNATAAQFGAAISRDWQPGGLVITLELPLDRLAS
jgi:PAS domain S-box-containing protein